MEPFFDSQKTWAILFDTADNLHERKIANHMLVGHWPTLEELVEEGFPALQDVLARRIDAFVDRIAQRMVDHADFHEQWDRVGLSDRLPNLT